MFTFKYSYNLGKIDETTVNMFFMIVVYLFLLVRPIDKVNFLLRSRCQEKETFITGRELKRFVFLEKGLWHLLHEVSEDSFVTFFLPFSLSHSTRRYTLKNPFPCLSHGNMPRVRSNEKIYIINFLQYLRNEKIMCLKTLRNIYFYYSMEVHWLDEHLPSYRRREKKKKKLTVILYLYVKKNDITYQIKYFVQV